jgi:hypothetical protein
VEYLAKYAAGKKTCEIKIFEVIIKAIIAKARVPIAKYAPLSRRQGMPMIGDTIAAAAPPAIIEMKKGTP